jgi:hypothetical protein
MVRGWFRVQTKAGQILEYGRISASTSIWQPEYGYPGDARIEAQGKSTVRTWALNRLQDTKGNYLNVSYSEDTVNGDYYPQRIEYTGNANTGVTPNNMVQFSYEARPDITPLYHAGSLIKTTLRLAKIQSYAGGALSQEYRLHYDTGNVTGRSRIVRVSECGGDGQCLPEPVFQWQDTTAQAIEQASLTVMNPANGGYYTTSWPARKQAWVDVNGDDKVDWCRSVGNGPASNIDAIICTLNLGSGGPEQTVMTTINPSSGGYAPADWLSRYQAWTDVNGDGKADWCRSVGNGPGSNIDAIICTINLGSDGLEQTVMTTMNPESGGYYAADWDVRNQVWTDVADTGKAQWCRSVGNGAGSNIDAILCTGLPPGGGFDLLTAVTNGLGTTTSVVHKPLTDSSVYIKDSGSDATSYPNRSANTTLRSRISHRHKWHRRDSYNKLHVWRDESRHERAWHAGIPVGTGSRSRNRNNNAIRLSAGLAVHRLALAHEKKPGRYRQRWPAEPGQQYIRLHLLRQRLLSPHRSTGRIKLGAERRRLTGEVTTSSQYDTWGNATQINIISNDGFSKITTTTTTTTTNTYANDPGNWFLGRLLRNV